jgi:hypothetical protein
MSRTLGAAAEKVKRYGSMHMLTRLAMAGLLAGSLALGASPVWGQTNNTNNNNNNTTGGFTPAGVIISPEGVLRVKPFTDRTGDLTRTRIAESRARLAPALAKGSPLRKISLPRLEAALAECVATGKEPGDEMKALAGLTRVQYVFYYPESKDIVIAGPAEGFFTDFTGRWLRRCVRFPLGAKQRMKLPFRLIRRRKAWRV